MGIPGYRPWCPGLPAELLRRLCAGISGFFRVFSSPRIMGLLSPLAPRAIAAAIRVAPLVAGRMQDDVRAFPFYRVEKCPGRVFLTPM